MLHMPAVNNPKISPILLIFSMAVILLLCYLPKVCFSSYNSCSLR